MPQIHLEKSGRATKARGCDFGQGGLRELGINLCPCAFPVRSGHEHGPFTSLFCLHSKGHRPQDTKQGISQIPMLTTIAQTI